ncbi:MAG: DUF2339 domain-containing protein [Pirellulales bacterium]
MFLYGYISEFELLAWLFFLGILGTGLFLIIGIRRSQNLLSTLLQQRLSLIVGELFEQRRMLGAILERTGPLTPPPLSSEVSRPVVEPTRAATTETARPQPAMEASLTPAVAPPPSTRSNEVNPFSPVPSQPQLPTDEIYTADLVASPATKKPPVSPPLASDAHRPLASSQPVSVAPVVPRPLRQPSRIEVAAQEILGKIWNWIVVGEEHRPKGVAMEFAVASTWLLRLGVLILVMAVGFFLKYSIERDYVGPLGRVAISILIGISMLVVGVRMLGKQLHAMGQGLIGGGIATLYFAVFAAFHFYHLIEMGPAFALMTLVTVFAGALSIRVNSMLIAILGILGGYGTPLMLSTGEVNFVGLYAYMMLLGAGVLGISYYKHWHLLNYLSFLCNYVLVVGSLRQYQVEYFWQVQPFLVGFFMLYSTLVFLYQFVNRAKSSLLDVFALLLNSAVFFGISYWLVSNAHGYRWVAVVSLSLAAFYSAHVWYCLVRKVLDRDLMFSFLGLASTFVAITIPLVLSRQWITASWAVQALVMLWIAGKLDSRFLRHAAYLLYLLVVGRFCFLDLGRQYSGSADVTDAMPLADYLWIMLERVVVLGTPIASLAGAVRLLRQTQVEGGVSSETSIADRTRDMGEWIRDRWAIHATVLGGAAMAFVFLNFEIHRTVGYLFPPLRLPLLTSLWIAACGLLLWEYSTRRSQPLLFALVILASVTVGKLFVFDLPSWNVGYRMLYDRESYSFLEAGMRLLDFSLIVGFFWFVFRSLAGDVSARVARQFAGFVGLALLFLFLSLEVNTFLAHFVPGLRAGGVTILWSLFAIGCLLGGIWRDLRTLRYIALTLFAVVGWKVLFSDLARLDQVYRIVAFGVLGLLVLAGSFIYLKHRSSFAVKEESTGNVA